MPRLKRIMPKITTPEDGVSAICAFRNSQLVLHDLLIALMADLIKIDKGDNYNACQRVRVNSIKFAKAAKVFRLVSVQVQNTAPKEADAKA